MTFNKTIHSSWCFYACVWAACLGIILSLATRLIIFSEAFWLVFALLFLGIALFCPTRFTILFAVSAGLIFANFRVSSELINQDLFSQLSGQTITISGTIAEDPDLSDPSPSLRLNHLKLQPSASADSSANSATELSGTLYVKLASRLDLERSDVITLKGKLGDGFGTFVGTLFRPEVVSLEKLAPGDIFAKFKNAFSDLIHQFIPSPEAELGLGYLMGMKSGLSDSFSDALRAVGMTHVVVASGAHLSILTNAIRKLFGKISKFAGLLFALLMILGFACVVGFTPSMTRASLVAILSLLAGHVGRQFTPLRLIGFVAMLTLFINPINFLNLGWQLSFASFFGILVLGPRLQRHLYGGKTPPWLASMLITSISTSLICAPILIYNFGSISLLSLVANLIILPTLPYIMLAVLLTGVTSFLPWLAAIIAKIATLLLSLHITIINYLSEQKAFIFELPSADPRIFLLYLPIVCYLCYPAFLRLLRRKPSPQPLAVPP